MPSETEEKLQKTLPVLPPGLTRSMTSPIVSAYRTGQCGVFAGVVRKNGKESAGVPCDPMRGPYSPPRQAAGMCASQRLSGSHRTVSLFSSPEYLTHLEAGTSPLPRSGTR